MKRLIHFAVKGDFNKVSYYKKIKKLKRGSSGMALYFIPNDGADHDKIEREFRRVDMFFRFSEGAIFGAINELSKLGELKKEEVYQ